ncbi:MAG: serine/threonine protein kinase [Chloracidobacterium sp.]|nr:serine/threonine protein kinase [Chloracidobacterium sp.]
MSIHSIQGNKWEEINALFMTALSLGPQERLSFLGKQHVSSEVIKEVESLLAFEDDAEEILQTSAIEFSRDFFDVEAEMPSTMAGQEIGAYRIISELGVGGMGAVYLAERRDGKFDQKVAIKLLKREFNAGKVREAFRREIEIQSKLVHPNVAAMHDTGTTGDGIPYIVMEYVDGLPIDKYCYEKNLGLNGRLKIFNKACEAVAFAHHNLIIHRDLKPSNIIVTPEGNPKLLDFGISKLMGAVENVHITTLFGAMTPEYASPEQVAGAQVTTATDVYSLGVILFKLLTGSFPYKVKGKRSGDMLKEIPDSYPTLPSEAASFSPSPLPPFSPSRLKGDIDNVILKALNKEPEERYRTVEQFAEDIWRYIDGVPVAARPATLAYRFKKFYGRNRITVLAGALIFVSIITGSFVAVWQANAAVMESDRAKSEQAKSEKISKFMAKMISYANAAWYGEGAKFGGDARVIDALLDMSDKIDAEFADEPDIAAEVHHKFGEALGWAHPSGMDKEFANLLQKKQQYHLMRALELRVQYYGEWHELVAKDLFYCYGSIGQNDADRAALLDRALNMMRDTNPNNLNFPYMIEAYTSRLMLPNTPETHDVYRQAVTPPTDENKYEIAERYLRESLPIFRLHYKEDNVAIFGAECKLAYTLAMQEKWADFDEHYNLCKKGAPINQRLLPALELIDKKLAEFGRQR